MSLKDKDALPKDYIHIRFERDDTNENIRILDITSYGKKYDQLLNKLED